MIRSDEPPVARALAIEDALAFLEAANVPVKLRPALAVGGVTAVSVGGAHACAIDDRRALYCWGANDDGQLGIDSRMDAPRPRRVAALSSGVAQVAAGGRHTCAINTGRTFCWGTAALGALGVKGTDASARPTLVSQSLRFSQISRQEMALPVGSRPVRVCLLGRERRWSAWYWTSRKRSDARTRASARDRVCCERKCGPSSTEPYLCSWFRSPCALLGLESIRTVGPAGSRKQATPIATHPKQRFRSVAVGSNRSCALLMDSRIACWGEGSTGKDGVAELFATAERADLHVMSGRSDADAVRGAMAYVRCFPGLRAALLGFEQPRSNSNGRGHRDANVAAGRGRVRDSGNRSVLNLRAFPGGRPGLFWAQ